MKQKLRLIAQKNAGGIFNPNRKYENCKLPESYSNRKIAPGIMFPVDGSSVPRKCSRCSKKFSQNSNEL
jgi:hypothetical protein